MVIDKCIHTARQVEYIRYNKKKSGQKILLTDYTLLRTPAHLRYSLEIESYCLFYHAMEKND